MNILIHALGTLYNVSLGKNFTKDGSTMPKCLREVRLQPHKKKKHEI